MSGYFISQGGVRNQHYIDDTRESNDDLWWQTRLRRSMVSCKWCGKVESETHDGKGERTYVECEECKRVGLDNAESWREPEPDFEGLSSIEKLERLAKYKRSK